MSTLPASQAQAITHKISKKCLFYRLKNLMTKNHFESEKEKQAREAIFKVDYRWFNPDADMNKVAGMHPVSSHSSPKNELASAMLVDAIYSAQESGVIQMQIAKQADSFARDAVLYYYTLGFKADSDEQLDMTAEHCDIIRVELVEGQDAHRSITLLRNGLDSYFDNLGYKDCNEFYDSYLMMPPRLRVKHNMDYLSCKTLYYVLEENNALSADIEQCLKGVTFINTLALAEAYDINLKETLEPKYLERKIVINGYDCYEEGTQIDHDAFDWFSSIMDSKLQDDESVDWYRLYYNGRSIVAYKDVA